MNMNKHFISHIITCLAASAVLLTAVGCGGKTVNYSIDDTGGVTDSGSLVNVPDSYSGNLQTGSSGISEISLNDDHISYPGKSYMVKSYYTRHVYSSTEIQTLAEYLFDSPDEIYVYDSDNPDTQGDLASDDSYESDAFTGKIDGVDFVLYTGTYECFLVMEDDERLSYRTAVNAADYSNCYFSPDTYYSWYDDDTDSPAAGTTVGSTADSDSSSESSSNSTTSHGTNECVYTEKEALDIAQNFLETAGLSDIQLVHTANLVWTYCDEADNEVTSGTDGYTFTFVREVDNYPVTAIDVILNDNIPGTGLPPAKFSVYVSSRGIVGADWSALLEPTGRTETADLMTFEKIIEAANTSVCNYYTTYPIIYGGNTVRFNDITLSYFLTTGDNDDEFIYTPAWVLSEYDQSSRAPGEDYPNHLIAIDATDGSVIDISTLSEKLGGGSE